MAGLVGTDAMSRSPVVAVLGAESTGKTTLCEALARRFSALPGWAAHDVGLVGEALRQFCERTGRTPTPGEQPGLAELQMQRIAEAARRHRVVIADTSAVMTAVYSVFVFGDRSLQAAAAQAHRGLVDQTLVTALDLPWVPDGHQRDGPHVREPVDRLLRAALGEAGIVHAVIGGQGERRVEAAWRALAPLRRAHGWDTAESAAAPNADDATSSSMQPDPGAATPATRWRAWCECCAEPRLLPGDD